MKKALPVLLGAILIYILFAACAKADKPSPLEGVWIWDDYPRVFWQFEGNTLYLNQYGDEEELTFRIDGDKLWITWPDNVSLPLDFVLDGDRLSVDYMGWMHMSKAAG
jgi:hypothetical protein